MVINGQHVYPSAIDGIGYALSFQCAGGPMRAIDGSHSPAASRWWYATVRRSRR